MVWRRRRTRRALIRCRRNRRQTDRARWSQGAIHTRSSPTSSSWDGSEMQPICNCIRRAPRLPLPDTIGRAGMVDDVGWAPASTALTTAVTCPRLERSRGRGDRFGRRTGALTGAGVPSRGGVVRRLRPASAYMASDIRVPRVLCDEHDRAAPPTRTIASLCVPALIGRLHRPRMERPSGQSSAMRRSAPLARWRVDLGSTVTGAGVLAFCGCRRRPHHSSVCALAR